MSGSCDDCGNVECLCSAIAADASSFTPIVGNPRLRETVVGSGQVSPFAADAVEATTLLAASYEREIRCLTATNAALESQLASESREVHAAHVASLTATVRSLLDVLRRIGGYLGHEDQQALRDARAEVAG